MNHGSLLVVDDDRPLLESMADYLRGLGHRTETATTCRDAMARMKEYPFDAVICDVNLPDQDGFSLLEWAEKNVPETEVILLTGFGTIENAVEAIRMGAFDYLTKPIIEDELHFSIQRALGKRQIVAENKSLRAQLNQRFGMGNIVGHDYRMLKMFDLIESVADTKTTVLVLGESGTGKTMTARAIHQLSSRRDKPFVEVACGALPDSLLESELFGHVAGAFTGANHDKQGKFLQANGGTIFLDEIGTASASLQVKLLRVLQDREFEPVGGNKTQKVDVRMILATNLDLEEEVRKGNFRQDLYYRINVVTLMQPPLRERISDIPLLVEHYLKEFVQQTGKPVTGISEAALQLLQRYRWPGNVRELVNVIERAVVLTKNTVLQPHDLPEAFHHEDNHVDLVNGRLPGSNLKAALAHPEKYKKMKRYGISFEKQLMGS
jgi:DNA-binding NtrC family response regulator